MESNIKFGETVQKHRKLMQTKDGKKMTQERLAEMIGISPRYLSNIETGAANPTFHIVIALAENLNIDLNQFKKE